jgi:hypothetical protein
MDPEVSESLSPNWSKREGLAAGPSLSGLLFLPVIIITSNFYIEQSTLFPYFKTVYINYPSEKMSE